VADQVTDVWINGAHIVTHVGAYLPFTADITDYVRFSDQVNIIVVKVNNHTNRDIPVYGNWISYGELHRDVHLHVTDRLHITDAVYAKKTTCGGLFIAYPQFTKSLSQINIKTHVLNEYQQAKNCKIKTHLIDADHRLIITVESQKIINAGNDHTFD
jgi:beta-galactosidase